MSNAGQVHVVCDSRAYVCVQCVQLSPSPDDIVSSVCPSPALLVPSQVMNFTYMHQHYIAIQQQLSPPHNTETPVCCTPCPPGAATVCRRH